MLMPNFCSMFHFDLSQFMSFSPFNHPPPTQLHTYDFIIHSTPIQLYLPFQEVNIYKQMWLWMDMDLVKVLCALI